MIELMKWLLLVLIILLSYLQYRLWIGDGSLAHAHRLENEIKLQQAEIDRMRERNRILDVEVEELKTGLDTIEERARNDIGLIKKDETFFIILDDEK
ncbi:FtsB family cell division protein [Cellvibrio sp. QJXJ]|uniref:FtsB family cell division protein n=1 Tax=Cellvibrio sp. QJXJ TaxID=2964606 RepID=UPI0002F4B443